MASYQLENGITTICPATMTLAEFLLQSICSTASAYQKNPFSEKEAIFVGINMEGPMSVISDLKGEVVLSIPIPLLIMKLQVLLLHMVHPM